MYIQQQNSPVRFGQASIHRPTQLLQSQSSPGRIHQGGYRIQQPAIYQGQTQYQQPPYVIQNSTYPPLTQIQATSNYPQPFPFDQESKQNTPIDSPKFDKDVVSGIARLGVDYLKSMREKLERTLARMQPFVILSLLLLIFAFVMAWLIYPFVSSETFIETPQSQAIFRSFQKDYQRKPFSGIKNADGNGRCLGSWKKVPFGRFGGVSQGCICPNFQTSTQACNADCFQVQGIRSREIHKFNEQMVCVLPLDNGNQLNHVEQVTTGFQRENVVKIGDNYYLFSFVNNGDEPFVEFIVAPDIPCLNPKILPQNENGLTYPFYVIPEKGCDNYGTKQNEVVTLASSKMFDLFHSQESLINVTKLPFWSKYVNPNGLVNVYAERRIKIADDEDCKMLTKENFSYIAYQCNSVKVTTQIVCVILLICGILGLLCYIYSLYETQERLNHMQFKRVYINIEFLSHLDDALRKTIIIMAIMVTLSVFGITVYYYFLGFGTQSLSQAKSLLSFSLKKNCIQSPGMVIAQKELLKISGTCITNFGLELKILFTGVIVYSILMSAFIVNVYRANKAATAVSHSKYY